MYLPPIYQHRIQPGRSPYAVKGTDPVVVWDFDSGVLPAGFALSRTSSATGIEANGDLWLAPNDTLRFDESGLLRTALLEPASTNMLSHSATVSGAGWAANGANVSNLTLGALGQFMGCRVASNGATWNQLAQTNTPTLVAGNEYTVSAWVLMGSSGYARIVLKNVSTGDGTRALISSNGYAFEGESAGPVNGVDIRQIGDAYRLTVRFTSNFTSALSLGIGPGSAVIGEDVILLAAQLEEGPTATSYIPTSGAAATRAADVVTWGAPEGLFDLQVIGVDGFAATYSTIQTGSGWQPTLPFAPAQVALFPAGTL